MGTAGGESYSLSRKKRSKKLEEKHKKLNNSNHNYLEEERVLQEEQQAHITIMSSGCVNVCKGVCVCV